MGIAIKAREAADSGIAIELKQAGVMALADRAILQNNPKFAIIKG